MTFVDKPTEEVQPCGCKTITTPIISRGSYDGPNPIVKYEPCLPCALANAGIMLQQAAERMREGQEREQEEAAAQAERLRVQAEDTIGGND